MWTTGNRASCLHGRNIFRNGCQGPPNTNQWLVDGDTYRHTGWWCDPPVRNYVVLGLFHVKQPSQRKTMKLRATIDIEFEADDIMDAKDKIDQLQKDLQVIEEKYGEVTLTVKERRGIKSEKRSS